MKHIIIGICGHKQAGKDTIAEMIAYINSVGLAKANYTDFVSYRRINNDNLQNKIIRFADALKKCISIIYNIPIEYLYDNYYKDECWYCLDNQTFYDHNTVVNHKELYDIINLSDITIDKSLSDFTSNDTNKFRVIKVRTILQYFGTNMCRKFLGENIWIRATMGKADEIAQLYNVCIIPDVRFENEAKTIQQHPFYGGLIKVNRNNITNDENSKHISEAINIDCEYNIDNNSTFFTLFYKVLNIYQNIVLNKKL